MWHRASVGVATETRAPQRAAGRGDMLKKYDAVLERVLQFDYASREAREPSADLFLPQN